MNPDSEVAALGTRTARRNIARDWRRAAAQTAHLACAGLFTIGGVWAWFNFLRALRYHIFPSEIRLAVAGLAPIGGLVLGFLLPHRIIQRRLERTMGLSGEAVPSPSEANFDGAPLEFAASFTGGLLFLLGLLLAFFSWLTHGMEDWRSYLTGRFSFPPGAMMTLLCGPVLIIAAVIGAWMSVVLAAFHGWHRLAHQPQPRMSRLWVVLLIGGLIAAAAARVFDSKMPFEVASPLAVFLGSVMAVWRRLPMRTPMPPASNWSPPTPMERKDLLIAGIAVQIGASAVFLVQLNVPTPIGEDLMIPLILGGLGGMALAGALRRRIPPEILTPILILTGAILLLVPLPEFRAGHFATNHIRLMLVSCCSAMTMIIVAGHWGQPGARIQRALSWIGGVGAISLGMAFLALLCTRSPSARLAWVMFISAIGTCGAGYMLYKCSDTRNRWRVVGCIVAAMWLCALPLMRPLSMRTAEPACITKNLITKSMSDEARALVSAQPFRSELVPPLPPSDGSAGAWNIDLCGPTLDLLVFSGAAGGADELTKKEGRRLLRRAERGLANGGRLLIEPPIPEGLRRALRQRMQLEDQARLSVYELTLDDGYEKYAAIAVGADIPELIERNREFCPFTVVLKLYPPRPPE